MDKEQFIRVLCTTGMYLKYRERKKKKDAQKFRYELQKSLSYLEDFGKEGFLMTGCIKKTLS